jgi:peroxiredoxin
MKILSRVLCALSVGVVVVSVAKPVLAIPVGTAAPNVVATDINGRPFSLADLKGKNVVFEWHNKGCPFVKKHYDAKNMQKIQKDLTGQGFVWVTVVSSATGKQGAMDAKEAKEYFTSQGAAPSAVILDADGKIGKLFEAKVTPHMFVVDSKGLLAYNGAIDDNDSSDSEVIAKSKNYILAAAADLKAGKKVQTATSKPYGCSVKYKE